MKLFIGIPLFLLAIVVGALLVVALFGLRLALKLRKYMRGDYSDEEVERLSKKFHRDNNDGKFAGDYFKRSERSYSRNGYQQERQSQQRTTHTADGVTIVDNRHGERTQRKIFTEDEGEYVDFQETE